MVESPSFVVQNEAELKSRFTNLINNEIKIFYQDIETKKSFQILEALEKNKYYFKSNENLANENRTFYFSINSVKFFFQGSFEKINHNVFDYIINVRSELYKYERREDERLLMYPHRKAYISFDQSKKDNNILYFSKTNKEEGISTRISEKDKLNNVFNLRVLDLSKKAVAFLANQLEKDFLESTKINKVKLSFEGEAIDLNGFEYFKTFDFVDGRAKHIPMFKLIFKFEANIDLENYLDKFTDSIDRKVDLISKFQEFID